MAFPRCVIITEFYTVAGVHYKHYAPYDLLEVVSTGEVSPMTTDLLFTSLQQIRKESRHLDRPFRCFQTILNEPYADPDDLAELERAHEKHFERHEHLHFQIPGR